MGKKISLLVHSSQGDLVGLEFKQEMPMAEMSTEERKMLILSEKRGQGFKNKVEVFDVQHYFLKEIMLSYSQA